MFVSAFHLTRDLFFIVDVSGGEGRTRDEPLHAGHRLTKCNVNRMTLLLVLDSLDIRMPAQSLN